MEKEEFFLKLKENAKKNEIDLSESILSSFYEYMVNLLEWNEKINLTAITDENEIIIKHFIDSLTIYKYVRGCENIIDIGTGAGFPGIPLKIVDEKIKITLLDSLNKRIIFLEEIIKQLKLKNINAIHSRAEEAGINKQYRQKYDIATSRAVANLSTLVEYMLPFVKVGGKCICMKGANIEQELEESKKAIKILGGEIKKIEKITIPGTDYIRNIIIIKKVGETPNRYPRKAGKPSKEPIV